MTETASSLKWFFSKQSDARFLPETISPIKADYKSDEEFRDVGRDLAKERPVNLPYFVKFDFGRRLGENSRLILHAFRATDAAARNNETISPAAQWLLDNHYAIDKTVQQARRDFPSSFLRQLPLYKGLDAIPRIFAMAWLYVAHSDSNFSVTSLTALVEGYQEIGHLQIGELWALPSAIRVILVENARRLSLEIERARRMRQFANQVADKIALAKSESERLQLFETYTPLVANETFATHLLYRLRGASTDSTTALAWLEQQLAAQNNNSELATSHEHGRQSRSGVIMGNIIRSLKAIDDVDWTSWFETVSQVDALLRENSDFTEIDFQSRNIYRVVIEKIARRSPLSELEVTQKAIDLANREHSDKDQATKSSVAWYFMGAGRKELEKACSYKPSFATKFLDCYRSLKIWSIAIPVSLLTVIILAVIYSVLRFAEISPGFSLFLTVLAIFPTMDSAFSLFNTLISWFVTPTRLIGYEYKNGIPEEAKTLVVVPTMITSRDFVDELVRNLEVHYLTNPHGAVSFALATDWADSDIEETKDDLELYDYTQALIKALNNHYCGDKQPRFFLLHRHRLYNESEGCWMGWERKRGKLHELNLLLRGDKDTSFFPADDRLPMNFRFVVTLDSDTRLTPEAVTKLVGKLNHPLNRPIIGKNGQIVNGYGLLQPRVTPSLTTGDEASFLQRVFSVNRGIDPYVFAVSDTYQDLLGEGTFTGKGIYDIDAFEAALDGRISENAVLSHDLLEGGFSRCALVSDIEVVEDYPTAYNVDVARHHRWIRGDWQLLPYLLSFGKINLIARWKMQDNLRRSLTPLFWLLASLAGWCLLPLTGAIFWQTFLVASMFVSLILGVLRGILPTSMDNSVMGHIQSVLTTIGSSTADMVLRLTFLAHGTFYSIDAIVRTLYRLFISRRKLLEWRTSAATKLTPDTLTYYVFLMWPASIIGIVMMLIPMTLRAPGVWVSLPFGIAWVLSPLIAWLVSRSAALQDSLDVRQSDKGDLRRIARRTWVYYESFANEANHFLPPDNFQESPEPVVAQRTSPTNIGVYLLSTVAARDFGWISFRDTLDRLAATLETMGQMERYRGHFYNWYETDSLRPLVPSYVSTVDSGNLAGHLVTLAAALSAWAEAPSVYIQPDLEGLLDVNDILEECISEIPDDRRVLRPLRQRINEHLKDFRFAVRRLIDEPQPVSFRALDLTIAAQDILRLIEELAAEIGIEEASRACRWAKRLIETCRAHEFDGKYGYDTQSLRQELLKLAKQARQFAFDMKFDFLERPERRLLSIGYRVQENELDASCYDLLASEARLSSLFAIAKGDIKVEHWFRLGRLLVPVGWKGALLSWSGSMFEYLMPPLVMHEPLGSLLDQTNRLVVRRQMQYAKQLGLPWGISEAAFNARDQRMNYQYSNFGVPSLGLQRGLSRNAVIAPYASILASQYLPAEANANLKRLRALGALGEYGFYDSIDFTPSRLPEGKKWAVVKNYYAHHHGMSILAVNNVVFDGRMRDRFHSDPVIEAAELLLQEKAPREIPLLHAKTANPMRSDSGGFEDAPLRIIKEPLGKSRTSVLLANNDYSVMLTANGSGYSRWKTMDITRFRPDPTEDQQGSFLFLRDISSGRWWSATGEPTRVAEEETMAIFSDEKAEFQKTVDGIRSNLECIIASEATGEGRRIELFNATNKDRIIEVTSYNELALAEGKAYGAHPVFSQMFIETDIADNGATVFARRRKRDPMDEEIHFAHFVTDGSGAMRRCEAETDRRVFIGRGRSIRRPAAFDRDTNFLGNQGDTLDPIAAIRCRVRVPAHKKAHLIFWTMVAASREVLEQTVQRYRQPDVFSREYSMAWMHSQVQLFQIGVKPSEASDFQKFATPLIYPERTWRLPGEAIAENLGQQSDLWPMAISGDYPICLLRLDSDADMRVLQSILRAHEYWRNRGLVVDLVVLNERAFSYAQDTQRAVEWLCEGYRNKTSEADNGQHIFTLRRDQLSDQSFRTLLASARIVLQAQNGSLSEQLKNVENIDNSFAVHDQGLKKTTKKEETKKEKAENGTNNRIIDPVRTATAIGLIGSQTIDRQPVDTNDLTFWNGYGGFDADGAYVIRLNGQRSTPQPWVNIIANENFGMLVSAEGCSFTWAQNSRDYQLTPWSNDPVSNRPGEAIYIVDRHTLERFSPVSIVERHEEVMYQARHGLGFTAFASKHGDLELELTHTVDVKKPLRFSRLTLHNCGTKKRSLRLYNYVEWVLANTRAQSTPYIIPSFDAKRGAFFVRNPYHLMKNEVVNFVVSNVKPQSVTSDRAEFIGATGTVKHPAAIRKAEALSNSVEAGRDICSALAYDIELKPGEKTVIDFVLGSANSQTAAEQLLDQAVKLSFDEVLEKQLQRWSNFVSGFQVDTPDPAFNLMVNRWIPYQAYACRILARTGFYQASGAFGFRDQLQDSLSMLLLKPELARSQILTAASRQFVEGDVQHWWLPETGAGVRSTISDDIVWLAYATALYVKTTGDTAVLDEKVSFIAGETLKDGEHDRYFQPQSAETQSTLYEHCTKALDLALSRFGQHNLPLMLGGDWNDGMNLVGAQGKGESVWLGWFLGSVLQDFIAIAKKRGDKSHAETWTQSFDRLKENLEKFAWDGSWYRRGFYDDGSALGSSESEECQIDTIAQSWSVLSGMAPLKRQQQAMQSTLEHLLDEDASLLRLFWPPFKYTKQNPGYIKAYPAGVRENGGQYTHGALWSVLALSQIGEVDKAYELLAMINPVNHGQAADRYRVEPYVVAADVYDAPQRRGMGGWTWYTGSAGWFYRAATEAILGITRQGTKLFIAPAIPSHWEGFKCELRFGDALYKIAAKRGSKRSIRLNGKVVTTAENGMELQPQGQFDILVTVPNNNSVE